MLAAVEPTPTQAAATATPRVLQVFNQYLESGGEEVWVNEISRFSGRGFTVDDLRFQSSEWTRKGAPTRLRQAQQVWDNPGSRDRLRAAVEGSKPDLLLFHNLIPVGSLGLYDEAANLGLPVVQYIHNFRPFSPSGTMWVNGRVHDGGLRGNPWPEVFGRAWERSFLRTFLVATYQSRLLRSGTLDVVKRWIAVSEFMRGKFISAGIPADKVVTLRHCWKPRANPEASRMGGHYLFLGRLVPEKGTYTMLDAWRILEKRLGDACPRLIIAGAGPEEARIHAATARMKKVVCVGFVSGKPKDDLLHGCRALIAPSIWWEPLGLIVYEAYDFARPVLAAASGGLTETVQEGVTGFLHEPGDATRLADDVERMEALGAQGRAAMGQAGRAWLLKHASPEQWLDRFSAILRSVSKD
jgi:glycosyltransferase involved in cell wall biosynthesis